MYQKFELTLTRPQALKLRRGGAIQLSPSQLAGSKHHVMVHPLTHKKMASAQKKMKGVRVSMSEDEFIKSGEGLKEFFSNVVHGMKKGSKWLKENVIDTPEYQKYLKPLVRRAVDTGLVMATPTLGPGAVPVSSAVNKLGELTGAYGVKPRGRPRKQKMDESIDGEGFRESVAKVKDVYQKHLKKHVAPHLKKSVRRVAEKGVSKLEKALPYFADDIKSLSAKHMDRAVDELGRVTSAYGIKGGAVQQPHYYLQSGQQQLLGPLHPASNPMMDLPDMSGSGAVHHYVYSHSSMANKKRKPRNAGGSFKLAGQGGSFMLA